MVTAQLWICDTDGWFCGCCGDEIEVDGDIEPWCRLCAEHVAQDGAPWNATFAAQHGRPCPYGVVDP